MRREVRTGPDGLRVAPFAMKVAPDGTIHVTYVELNTVVVVFKQLEPKQNTHTVREKVLVSKPVPIRVMTMPPWD